MRKMIMALVAGTVWLWSGAAMSQATTCGDLDWGNFEAEYPGIGSACQGVVYRDGTAYAKFKAKMVRRFNDGTVNLRIIRPDGTWFVETFNPPEDFIVETAAGPMTFATVPAMGDINVSVPAGERFTIAPSHELNGPTRSNHRPGGLARPPPGLKRGPPRAPFFLSRCFVARSPSWHHGRRQRGFGARRGRDITENAVCALCNA